MVELLFCRGHFSFVSPFLILSHLFLGHPVWKLETGLIVGRWIIVKFGREGEGEREEEREKGREKSRSFSPHFLFSTLNRAKTDRVGLNRKHFKDILIQEAID